MAQFVPNHPPRAPGVNVPVINYGVGDTNASWALFTTPNPLFRTYILPNIGQLPFIREGDAGACNPSLNSWFVTAVIGRMRAHVRGMQGDDVNMPVAIGEYFAADLPVAWRLDQNASREALARVVKVCFGFINIPNIAVYTNWFVMTNQAWVDIDDQANFDGTNVTRAGLPDHWPFTEQEGTALNSGQCLQLLYVLSNFTREDLLTVMVQHLVSAVVATIKQGTVTRRFLDKIVDGISSELSINIHLDEDVIKNVHARVLVGISDENISYILERWFNFLPMEALRLRLTIAQATGTGLTALNVIGKALIQFPDFCWEAVAALFPADWNNFRNAAGVVGQNPWYGYRRDLGPAASTKYKVIAWIAKEVLIRFGNQATLNQYRGWLRRIPHQDVVEEWFRQYVQRALDRQGNVMFDDNHVWLNENRPAVVQAENPVYL